ncbi:DEAD/DEAH box helicase, partial [Gorillibacterium massiliense]|uniref:DEAD/DEAH box helicase n=1 Tax=Gorillibacterium massiliense TaxID=1280390 RepID=UPI0012DF2667
MTDSDLSGAASPIPLHPVISAWFSVSVGKPTDVQMRAWPSIESGKHTLIAAPTGSGKTLAALVPCLDRLVRQKMNRREEMQQKGVRILYVTPLKALNNDIRHHVIRFSAEMDQIAAEQELEWPGITVGVRTGDTTQSTRASMLRNPPDLLITTPESLYIILTSPRGRDMLKTVEMIIVDEIHDLAADKRGIHLMATLERLVWWCGRSPQRIGVSATQKPLSRMAQFLGGWEEAGLGENPEDGETLGAGYRLRPVEIIESPMERVFSLTVTMADLSQSGGRGEERAWNPVLDRLEALMEGSHTVLIFVNSRRLCERLTLRLNERAGKELARSHHGSVSREKRLEVEAMLKAGELRCLVATSSLELGIDVGFVDLVIQLDSPKSAASGIQRFGRAGHAVGGTSRGALVARTRG